MGAYDQALKLVGDRAAAGSDRLRGTHISAHLRPESVAEWLATLPSCAAAWAPGPRTAREHPAIFLLSNSIAAGSSRQYGMVEDSVFNVF